MWRISADILLFVSIYILPWWFSIFALVVLILIFRFYWEGLAAALLADILYAPPTLAKLSAYRFTLVALATFLFVELVARRLIRAYGH